MKGLTRFEYKTSRGWYARVRYHDERGVAHTTSKYFADSIHGGYVQARMKAKLWISETRDTHGVPQTDKTCVRFRHQKRVGVSKVTMGGIPYIKAELIDGSKGRKYVKLFSIKKLGVREAIRQAREQRQTWEQMVYV